MPLTACPKLEIESYCNSELNSEAVWMKYDLISNCKWLRSHHQSSVHSVQDVGKESELLELTGTLTVITCNYYPILNSHPGMTHLPCWRSNKAVLKEIYQIIQFWSIPNTTRLFYNTFGFMLLTCACWNLWVFVLY